MDGLSMTHNITAEQDVTEGLNLKAAMWANKILTGKLNNQQAKYEITQQGGDIADMETRVRKYLNAGLITDKTYAPKIDSRLANLKQHVKTPLVEAQSTSGSKDGLWSTNIGGKR